ncbi:CDP-diacylglycerol---serine O-phosphatidyltransferase [Terribacillus aidingensis]|uniref:CDP-diacylglycerol--serine O-phosphatidyltransferase n=1 Tax=Terribacillus aidingensis TaxID=586416 RepID=A0A285P1V0_9BACI|nr:CDP-diacylglycerol--serine O-phosphatidyltransferase [Terribacillus aidingensis]SNZ15714.1 CDP-diacylglycerol---serine O-phosphatidyltransferase [Terribacillus aidingensis]
MSIKKNIPNAITLGNMYCGFVSIGFTIGGGYRSAVLLILFGAIMDGMDGRIARILKVNSDIGKQLDSLADIITFGIAPSILFSYTNTINGGSDYFDYALAGLFLLCGAYRLARFNSGTSEDNSYFRGVPITAAGGVLAFTTLFHAHIPASVNMIIISVLSYLMVSSIKVPSFKNISVPSYGTLVTVLVGIGVLGVDLISSFQLPFFMYFLTPIYLLYVSYRLLIKRARRNE